MIIINDNEMEMRRLNERMIDYRATVLSLSLDIYSPDRIGGKKSREDAQWHAMRSASDAPQDEKRQVHASPMLRTTRL